MKKILFAAVITLPMVFAGCIFSEKKPQGVNFAYDATSSLGASEPRHSFKSSTGK